MSTHANIHFFWDRRLLSRIYRHADGYAGGRLGVITDLTWSLYEAPNDVVEDFLAQDPYGQRRIWVADKRVDYSYRIRLDTTPPTVVAMHYGEPLSLDQETSDLNYPVFDPAKMEAESRDMMATARRQTRFVSGKADNINHRLIEAFGRASTREHRRKVGFQVMSEVRDLVMGIITFVPSLGDAAGDLLASLTDPQMLPTFAVALDQRVFPLLACEPWRGLLWLVTDRLKGMIVPPPAQQAAPATTPQSRATDGVPTEDELAWRAVLEAMLASAYAADL
jgi:hypothetical protein